MAEKMKKHLSWTLGYTERLRDVPADRVPAEVPGEVQRIWGKAAGLPDFNFDKNYLEYVFMEDKFWHFETSAFVENMSDSEPILIFEGIDYAYTVFIDGEEILTGEGMFTPVKISLEKYVGREISIDAVIHPVPRIEGESGRSNAARSVKPPVSYGWDWHPRFIVSGFFGDAYIDYRPEKRIEAADFSYELDEKFTSLDFTAKISTNAENCFLDVSLTDDDGRTVCIRNVPSGGAETKLVLENPKLWWCRGQGERHFYSYKVELKDESGRVLDTFSRRVGFRRVRLVMNDDDFFDGEFPKTQAYSPATIELNGRRIFAKGTNFVPTEMCYSLMTDDRYKEMTELVSDANMNLLRLWGGGLVNKENFFDLCDEAGIMVWQEFPLACNDYKDDRHYLSVLGKEAESIVKRLKSHPSVVLYCGGNELFNGWSGMTNQSLALRLLDKVCLENDPKTPFIMTSPLYGMGHGSYLNITHGDVEAVTDFCENFRTAYTEFGIPSAASLDYVKRYIKEEDLYKIEPGTAWEDHHALNSWCFEDTWFRPSEVEAFYGKSDSLEETITHSLELQGESYKNMFEEARRKWPKTSMALNWCFNEPWPCFAGNSLVKYPAIPVPAYDRVRDALRDVMLSVRLKKLRYTRGEDVTCDVFVLNGLPETLKGASFSISVGGVPVYSGKFGDVSGNTSSSCGQFSFTVPDDAGERFYLTVECENAAMGGRYLLYLRP